LHWTVSGEALVVVILGGLGTLVGPALGAAIFVFLKHAIQGYTDHWHLFVGLVLIAVVMSGGRGLYGSLEDRLSRRRAARARPAAAPSAAPAAEPSRHA
jgi:branched-chain amino acid transport system permease protein